MNHHNGSVSATDRTVDWRHAGACRERTPAGKPLHDPELWFPLGETGSALVQAAAAKAVCRRCPVMEQCLQWALETGQDFGVWGGLTEGERRAMKRRASRRPTPKQEPEDALVFTKTGSLEEACRELYDRYTDLRDGHLVWVAAKTQAKIQYRERTYGQICFQAGHGRWPDGPVYRTCDEHQCVAPEHLTDKTIRAARKRAAERLAEAAAAAVP